jgi:hypothetical protein
LTSPRDAGFGNIHPAASSLLELFTAVIGGALDKMGYRRPCRRFGRT